MSKIDLCGDDWNPWRSAPPDAPCLRSGESQHRPVKSRNRAKHKIIRTTQTTHHQQVHAHVVEDGISGRFLDCRLRWE